MEVSGWGVRALDAAQCTLSGLGIPLQPVMPSQAPYIRDSNRQISQQPGVGRLAIMLARSARREPPEAFQMTRDVLIRRGMRQAISSDSA